MFLLRSAGLPGCVFQQSGRNDSCRDIPPPASPQVSKGCRSLCWRLSYQGPSPGTQPPDPTLAWCSTIGSYPRLVLNHEVPLAWSSTTRSPRLELNHQVPSPGAQPPGPLARCSTTRSPRLELNQQVPSPDAKPPGPLAW